jgi:hypothetical protein
MMPFIILLIIKALVFFPGEFKSDDFSGDQIQLWTAGPMHANEIIGKTGEVWFGLFHAKNGFEILKTEITVLDSPSTGGLYEKYVRTERIGDPVFLIRGMPELQEGPVKTVFYGFFQPQPTNNGINLRTDMRLQYLLSAGGKTSAETIEDYELKLSDRQTSQIITKRSSALRESMPILLWAGDLDGDGKLDLLIDMTDHYNVRQPTLFLSSRAKPGQLLEKVASYRKVGC